MKKWFNDIFFSFPLQLVILHLRNNLFLILSWVLLTVFMTGTIGALFGVKHLFLTPEYLGEVNFWSYFLLGLAFGGFFMTWNLTTYLLDAPLFPFLASLERPFTKFCLNNLIIPLAFVTIYLVTTIRNQWYNEYWDANVIFTNCFGFLIGSMVMVLLSSIYFYFTNKDILSFLKIKSRRPPNMTKNLAPGRRMPDVDKIKSEDDKWRVDTYLNESLRPRLVRSVAHYDSSVLISVFRQNHLNALIVQLLGLIILITFGYLIDYPVFRIPAGASIFILFSILIAISGAITYWFHKWRIPVFILLLLVINYLTKYDLFNHKNKGYGMDYTGEMATYNHQAMQDIFTNEVAQKDKDQTIQILNKWRAKFKGHRYYKPKMVICAVSGGGLKAGAWSMHVLQRADSLTNGKLLDHSVLFTGASGGLMGSAYLRELYLQKQLGKDIDIYNKNYIGNLSKDLLNSVCFTIVSNDLFMPWVKFEKGGFTYRKDRGYVFENQLNENTDFCFDKPLGYYRQPEADAIIPMMFITPSIVNDGRRLIISPQPVSYMTKAPIGFESNTAMEYDAVDFGQLFKEQNADSLFFSSAIRMNATYPYILPNVYLPSQPSIEVMDAGFRDNYGIMSATRFIHVFKDWIQENTSGVTLIIVSGWEKIDQSTDPGSNEGILESVFNPLGIAGRILELQDFEHDNNLGYIYDLLGRDKFDVIRFMYKPSDNNEKASMTFHLTEREKNDILNAFYLQENQEKMARLKSLVK